MTTNRPSCPLCGNNTKKNGTTSKSTTRWRCTHCGHSFTRNTQTHNKNTATMALFIQWATGTQSLTTFAAHHGVTRQTMHHRFREVSQVLFRLSRWENLEYAKKI